MTVKTGIVDSFQIDEMVFCVSQFVEGNEPALWAALLSLPFPAAPDVVAKRFGKPWREVIFSHPGEHPATMHHHH